MGWVLIALIGFVIATVYGIKERDIEVWAAIGFLTSLILGLMLVLAIATQEEVRKYENKQYSIEGLENKLVTTSER